jgi:hypothetical protein
MLPSVVGEAGEEDVVMAALDDVDGVDLHVTEVFDSLADRRWPRPERRLDIEALCLEPDASGLGSRETNR